MVLASPSTARGPAQAPRGHEDLIKRKAFFPEKGGSTREAKQVCTGCEVRSECLEYALGHDERFGVWGGLSERERRVLGRRALPRRDTTTPSTPVVPEPREHQTSERRESAAPPGRTAGTGMAATLPTGPRDHRPHRDRPQRPASTFPARARAAASSPDQAPDPGTGRPCARSAGRASRSRPTTTRAIRDRRPPAPHSPDDQVEAAGGTTVTTDAAETSSADTGAADDAAAAVAGPAVPDPPPDDPAGYVPTDVSDAARIVLAGQTGQPGADGVERNAVLTLASAITAGTPVAASDAGRWEWRAAAVTAVISGTVTRGRVGHAMGEPSQNVAHWVRRHLEGMALVDADEQARAGER